MQTLGTSDKRAGTLRARFKAIQQLEAFTLMKKDKELTWKLLTLNIDGSITIDKPTPEEAELARQMALDRHSASAAQHSAAVVVNKTLQEVWEVYAKQRAAE